MKKCIKKEKEHSVAKSGLNCGKGEEGVGHGCVCMCVLGGGGGSFLIIKPVCLKNESNVVFVLFIFDQFYVWM